MWLILFCLMLGVPPSPSAHSSGELPWFVKLGEVAVQRKARVSVVSQVVLVPDLPTLLDEISQWGPDGQWPVLIEDPVYAPMFIRRFAPESVRRRATVGDWSGDRQAKREAIERAASAAWDVDGRSPAMAAASRGLPIPPGLIVSKIGDGAVAAAALLAAGRGQDIVWLDVAAGHPNATLNQQRTTAWLQAVEDAVASRGRSWQGLGDHVDTITICRGMAARGVTSSPVAIPSEAGGNVAMTDVLGRRVSGERWAFVGWIFGDHVRTAYMANCSLFLQRDRAWLCDTYPDTPPWNQWALAPAATWLEKAGWTCDQLIHATLHEMMRSDMAGVQADLVMMNTKGNADFFRMAKGTDADPGDVPMLNTPAALALVHSWAFRSPTSEATVGGRWIDRGVYAVIGSSEEPQLQAFVPPELLTKRLAGGVPLLVAARWWPASKTPMARTWRINTIGDPLMLALPTTSQFPRVGARPVGDDVIAVDASAVQAMRLAEESPSDAHFANAIQEVLLLGRDAMACQLWTAGSQRGVVGPSSARAVFGALFRQGEREAMLDAWQHLSTPTVREGDMLWAAWEPLLGDGTDDRVLRCLSSSLSPGGAVDRARRLAPLLMRRFGEAAVTKMIQHARTIATSARQRRALEALERK